MGESLSFACSSFGLGVDQFCDLTSRGCSAKGWTSCWGLSQSSMGHSATDACPFGVGEAAGTLFPFVEDGPSDWFPCWVGREDVGGRHDSKSIGRLLGHGFIAGLFKEEVGQSGVVGEELGLSMSIFVSHPVGTQLADSCRAIGWGVCWHPLYLELGSLSLSVGLGMGGFRGRQSGGARGTG